MSSTAVDFETVREIAMALPGVQESLGAWGRAFKVRGKLMACKAVNRSAEEGTLAVRIDFAQRAKLLAADSRVFYTTAHYEPYPMILVRVARISREALSELLEKSCLFVTSNASKGASRKSAGSTVMKRRVGRAKVLRGKGKQ